MPLSSPMTHTIHDHIYQTGLDITKTESNNNFVLLCIELNKMNVVFSFFTDRKQH